VAEGEKGRWEVRDRRKRDLGLKRKPEKRPEENKYRHDQMKIVSPSKGVISLNDAR